MAWDKGISGPHRKWKRHGLPGSDRPRLQSQHRGNQVTVKFLIASALLASVSCAGAQIPAEQQFPNSQTLCSGVAGCMQRSNPIGTITTDLANWHLFTQSHGGTVSLLHGLAKRACDYARVYALFPTLDINAEGLLIDSGRSHRVGPGTIIRAECFQ